jgi:hypothetical protein
VGGGLSPGVTVPGLGKAVHGARRRRALKCLGMDTDLELSRAMGFQVSSHGLSRSCSDISDIVGCDAGPTVSGGKTFVQPVEQTGSCARGRTSDIVSGSRPRCNSFVTG